MHEYNSADLPPPPRIQPRPNALVPPLLAAVRDIDNDERHPAGQYNDERHPAGRDGLEGVGARHPPTAAVIVVVVVLVVNDGGGGMGADN